ncbi:hypothetical protein RIF29_18635 [Crotalaria pallida]|uniref:Uncharacterized protein n=1 Tax=Crotalaria pallida TaxID=3830 RepID=A0AAN9EXZ9_CROPI
MSPKKKNNDTRKKRRGSKSLSDLEFEELKGFVDLGFVFSEEDKDSSLATIIPGLQSTSVSSYGWLKICKFREAVDACIK